LYDFLRLKSAFRNAGIEKAGNGKRSKFQYKSRITFSLVDWCGESSTTATTLTTCQSTEFFNRRKSSGKTSPSLINYGNAGRSISFTNELVSLQTDAGTLSSKNKLLLVIFGPVAVLEIL